jgi:LacI family transcriptional regulator
MSVRMVDIAKAAQVSQATVSLVLNSKKDEDLAFSAETINKIRDVARKLNYRPNKLALAFKANRSHMIGFLEWGFFPRTNKTQIDGINDVIQGNFSCVTASHSSKSELEIMHLYSFVDSRLAGIIASWSGDPNSIPSYRDIVEKYRIPLVLLDREIEGLDCPTVSTDYFGIGYKATKALLEMGHREIVLVAAQKNPVSSEIINEQGYFQAMEEEGLKNAAHIVRPEFVMEELSEKDLSKYAKHTINFIKREFKDTTAIFTQGDIIAYHILNELRIRNIAVPEEISVMGAGDFFPSSLEMVSLSTVSENLFGLGQKATELLMAKMEGKEVPHQTYKMDVTVCLRRSTRML